MNIFCERNVKKPVWDALSEREIGEAYEGKVRFLFHSTHVKSNLRRRSARHMRARCASSTTLYIPTPCNVGCRASGVPYALQPSPYKSKNPAPYTLHPARPCPV